MDIDEKEVGGNGHGRGISLSHIILILSQPILALS